MATGGRSLVGRQSRVLGHAHPIAKIRVIRADPRHVMTSEDIKTNTLKVL